MGRLDGTFASLFSTIDDTDMIPTTQAVQGIATANSQFEQAEKAVQEFLKTELPALNKEMKKAGLKEIK